MKAARAVVQISDADQRILDEALELRNILTHHYFREHAEDFVSEKGRGEMKKELQLVIEKFKKADQILVRLYGPLWQKYGVDDEFVERELAEIRARAKLRDSKGQR